MPAFAPDTINVQELWKMASQRLAVKFNQQGKKTYYQTDRIFTITCIQRNSYYMLKQLESVITGGMGHQYYHLILVVVLRCVLTTPLVNYFQLNFTLLGEEKNLVMMDPVKCPRMHYNFSFHSILFIFVITSSSKAVHHRCKKSAWKALVWLLHSWPLSIKWKMTAKRGPPWKDIQGRKVYFLLQREHLQRVK